MTALEALAILEAEAAVLECNTRDINTPEVRDALDLLERYIRPEWLIPQFRFHTLRDRSGEHVGREGQQQVLRVTFNGIRKSVADLLGKQADALARKFHETHDMTVKEELARLLKEYGKVKGPWVFVAR